MTCLDPDQFQREAAFTALACSRQLIPSVVLSHLMTKLLLVQEELYLHAPEGYASDSDLGTLLQDAGQSLCVLSYLLGVRAREFSAHVVEHPTTLRAEPAQVRDQASVLRRTAVCLSTDLVMAYQAKGAVGFDWTHFSVCCGRLWGALARIASLASLDWPLANPSPQGGVSPASEHDLTEELQHLFGRDRIESFSIQQDPGFHYGACLPVPLTLLDEVTAAMQEADEVLAEEVECSYKESKYWDEGGRGYKAGGVISIALHALRQWRTTVLQSTPRAPNVQE